MLKYLISILALIFTLNMSAQVPTEQDCLGAIPVCQDTYYQPNSYSGTGNYPSEIPLGPGCPTNCMYNGEKNDVWYIFTVQTGGDLGFVITPNDNSDDYDWAVYSLNEYKCQDIYNHVGEMQVSCNWSGTPGSTGPNGNSTLNCQNAGGTPYNDLIPVNQGETYVINISNYSSTQYGYTLDFSISTAQIYDDVAPVLQDVQTDNLQCGVNELTFDFSEKVLCSTVQASDFALDGPGGPYDILSITGEACEVGGETEKTYTITFDPPFYQSGDYTLEILFLSFIQDLCGNNASTQSLEFFIDLESPVADAGDDVEIPFLTTTQLDGDVTGGSGNYTYDWTPADKLEDPTIEDPVTVPLTQTTIFTMNIIDKSSGCQASDEVVVAVVGGDMSLNTFADPIAVCEGEQSDLSVIVSGGSGDYTYSWTSDPPGFTSNIPNPSVFPTQTTTYFVEVNDGYSIINGQVTVQVYNKPSADAGPDQVINIGTFTTLDGTASNGTTPYSYIWEPASMINGPNNIENPQTIVLGEPQNYTLVVTDANSCVSEPDVVLINATGESLAAYPQADPQEICIGGVTTIHANATGGSENYAYSWTSTETGWSATGESVIVSPAQTTTYFVQLMDGYDTITAHLILPVHPLPEIELTPGGYIQLGEDTIMVCVRDTVVMDAGNPDNPSDMEYLWSNSWTQRYFTTKTNGNWFDIQDFSVVVTNPLTTCSNTDQLTVIFDFNQCEIGIEEKSLVERPVTIHPNPNQGLIYLQSDYKINSLDIKLLNLEGSIILNRHYNKIGDENWKSPIDISFLSKGIYLMQIKADGQLYTLKVVKN